MQMRSIGYLKEAGISPNCLFKCSCVSLEVPYLIEQTRIEATAFRDPKPVVVPHWITNFRY